MNRKNLFAIVVFCSLICISTESVVAQTAADIKAGWERSIHVEWGYTPPQDIQVAGFRLYQDGSPVCDFPGEKITGGDCTVELGKSRTSMTLTAYFAEGSESPYSAPFNLTDFGLGPVIIILVGK